MKNIALKRSALVVSTGFHRTHMTIAAYEAARRGLLDRAITGAYPTPRVRRIARALRVDDHGRIARLLERNADIPFDTHRALFLPELIEESSRAFTVVPWTRPFNPRLKASAMNLYGRLATHELDRLGGRPGTYHFRAGFGRSSIERAKNRGLVALCDHAAMHPSVAEALVERHGRLDEIDELPARRPHDPVWQAIADDLEQADAVVVNSDLLKRIFVSRGWPPERVHVIYLGVDDPFIESVPRDETPAAGALRLMFAGRLEPAKGADELITALASLTDTEWQLVVAGPVATETHANHRNFLDDPRVTLLGTIPRDQLARELSRAEVFVFPSFAEGSARVVFEAMAAGCYVITTPNSGTIVEAGVHGSLVPAADVDGLVAALTYVAQHRPIVAEVGGRNRALILSRYRQATYGDALAQLYSELADAADARS